MTRYRHEIIALLADYRRETGVELIVTPNHAACLRDLDIRENYTISQPIPLEIRK
jgi:hypothetical protein